MGKQRICGGDGADGAECRGHEERRRPPPGRGVGAGVGGAWCSTQYFYDIRQISNLAQRKLPRALII
jgi:hypothetical protein